MKIASSNPTVDSLGTTWINVALLSKDQAFELVNKLEPHNDQNLNEWENNGHFYVVECVTVGKNDDEVAPGFHTIFPI
jgi:hypothetical protein